MAEKIVVQNLIFEVKMLWKNVRQQNSTSIKSWGNPDVRKGEKH